MNTNFDKILEGAGFDAEIKSALTEAWENKVNEISTSLKSDIEKSVRAEMKEMYKNDSSNLVNAMNSMLGEAVETYSKSQADAIASLQEEKNKVAEEVANVRKEYEAKLAENIATLHKFVLSALQESVVENTEEANALRETRVRLVRETQSFKDAQKARISETIKSLEEETRKELSDKVREVEDKKEELEEAKRTYANKIAEHKSALTEAVKTHIADFDTFATSKLREEIAEFQEDKKALNERRVQFEVEAKAKLAETREKFISASKDLTARMVHKALTEEMSAIKEDIKIARENRFGRAIFEAYRNEFMGSRLLDESSEVNKIMDELNSVKSQLDETKAMLGKQNILLEKADLMAKRAKNEAIRTKTLNDLLRPLNKAKREVMENLLATTQTEKLTESFNKLLPSVMQENVLNKTTEVLAEHTKLNNSRVITGNRNKTTSNTDRTTKLNEERQEVLRLAGIIKE